jgi:pimeloyl-ACP methyl ester carboxylesterase
MGNLVLSDRSLHFQSDGSGEDVVLIHGLGANHAFWYLGIARRLAQRYRVLTYDLRGHGRSSMPSVGYRLAEMADDLDALMSHLGVEKAHVVGHSFGARVALCYAMLHPARVATLTIADTQLRSLQAPVRLGDWPHWPRWRQALLEQGYDDGSLPNEDEVISFRLLANFNALDRNFTGGGLATRGPAPSLRRRDMGRRGSARWDQLMRSDSVRAELDDEGPLGVPALREIGAPSLGVFGALSHCLPTGLGLREVIPDYRLLVVPGAGHFHPAIKPRAFTRILLAFFRRHPFAQRSPAVVEATG